jgi:hypothetical protein
LFERTDQFDDAYWTKEACTVTANSHIAPDGSMTADTVTLTGDAGRIARSVTLDDNANYTLSSFVNPISVTGNLVGLVAFNKANTVCSAQFNLSTGTLAFQSNATGSIEPAANGYFRIRMTFNAATGATSPSVRPISNAFNSGGFQNGNSLRLWGAMLSLTDSPYQRVTTAFDVTESGQRDCYGVVTDAVDDWYQTAAINLTTTPKVTVFAAVRKLSDAARGLVCEFGNPVTNNGTFTVEAPSGTLNDFAAFGRGTSNGTAARSSVAAPATRIMTGIIEIDSPSATLRLNGVQVDTNSTTMGTGNFGNHALFLGSRSGTSLFLNARLYALIVAGGSYPLSTIQRVERLLSRITPTVNL